MLYEVITLDGEPSYEKIPQGLHDTTQAYWKSNDVRRYAYWSVFAGACGFTYGNNAVIQMFTPEDKESAYGAKEFWYDAINDTGATQMKYLKEFVITSYSIHYTKLYEEILMKLIITSPLIINELYYYYRNCRNIQLY